MPDSERRRPLDVLLTRTEIRQLLYTGQQNDIEQGGLYDARSGCVNIWCSLEDKPGCWGMEIVAGDMEYPRSYVGALDWDWSDENTARAFVEVTPYDLLDAYERTGIPAEQWEDLLRWTEEKARELLALARSSPQLIGTHCPFCAYVLPAGELINELFAHIAEAHPHEKPTALVVGGQSELTTENDRYPLLPAEQE